jgi:hypothetical protein
MQVTFGPEAGSLYNGAVPDRARAGLRIRNSDEANMLSPLEHFAVTVAFAGRPVGFTELVARSVDST